MPEELHIENSGRENTFKWEHSSMGKRKSLKKLAKNYSEHLQFRP